MKDLKNYKIEDEEKELEDSWNVLLKTKTVLAAIQANLINGVRYYHTRQNRYLEDPRDVAACAGDGNILVEISGVNDITTIEDQLMLLEIDFKRKYLN